MCVSTSTHFKDIKCYAITEVPSMPPCLPSCHFWRCCWLTKNTPPGGGSSPVCFFITAGAPFLPESAGYCSAVPLRIRPFWVNAEICAPAGPPHQTPSWGLVGVERPGWDSSRPSQTTWTKQWRCCQQSAVRLSVRPSVHRRLYSDVSVLYVLFLNLKVEYYMWISEFWHFFKAICFNIRQVIF